MEAGTMSKTLNLVDALLARGRYLQTHGFLQHAAGVLRKLSDLPILPAQVAEETESRLAEIALDRGQLKQARRHLTAALMRQPEEARYHYLLAIAVEEDSDAAPERAERHYRRALALDPENAAYLVDFGLYLLDQGRI